MLLSKEIPGVFDALNFHLEAASAASKDLQGLVRVARLVIVILAELPPKQAAHQSELMEHVRSHSGDNGFMCDVERCIDVYTRNATLNNHQKGTMASQ